MATTVKSTGPNTSESQTKRTNTLAEILRRRDFRLLWIGQGTSLLGDQFYLVALPWLVLRLTGGDSVALGTVLALAGLPRALFMLIGGAITDRFSPRKIMLISDVVRLLLTILLTIMVLTGQMQLWMLYVLALAFGTVSGFFLPASSTIMPQLVNLDNLQAANSLFQGTAQLSMFIGPGLAGALIALVAASPHAAEATTTDMKGIALAFSIDALTFAVSILTLWLMSIRPLPKSGNSEGGELSVWTSIQAGLQYVWQDPLLRMMSVIIAGMNLLFVGPLLVGIPYLANQRLPEGAAAFGLIMSAYGGGNLLGYVVSGASNKSEHMGLIVSGILGTFGLGMVLFGFTTSTAFAFFILLVLGIGNGYIYIVLITWLQKRTPLEMLGRMMSLLWFSSIGLAPVSQALCGALMKWSLTGVFVGAGILMLLIAIRAGTMPETRTMGLALAGQAEPKSV